MDSIWLYVLWFFSAGVPIVLYLVSERRCNYLHLANLVSRKEKEDLKIILWKYIDKYGEDHEIIG